MPKFFTQLFFLLLLSSFLTPNVSGQGFVWDWGTKEGGMTNDATLSVDNHPDGTACVTGYFTGTMNLPGYSFSSAGGEDIFYAKYDISGTLVWAKKLGGNRDDRGTSVFTGPSGNWYITGYFENTIVFDNGGAGISLTSAGRSDIFLAKINPVNGQAIWAVRAGGSGNDYASSVAIADTLVYVGGWIEGAATFSSITTAAPAGSADGYTAAYSEAQSRFVWVRTLPGPQDDRILCLTADSSGVYAGGFYQSGPLNLGFTSLVTNNGNNGILVKYAPSSAGVWARSITGTLGINQQINGLTIGKSGLYAVGMVDAEPSVSISGSPGLIFAATGNSQESFISRFNPTTGNPKWAFSEGGNANDAAFDADNTQNGVLVCGLFTNNITYPNGTTYLSISTSGYISRYDSLGAFVNADKVDGNSNDQLVSLAIANTCKVYASGIFRLDCNLGSTTTLNASGLDDGLVGVFSIGSPQAITVSAITDSICLGDSVTLTVSPGNLGTLQWQSSPTGMNTWTNITNATDSTLKVGPSVTTDYRPVFTSLVCTTVWPIQTITVLPLPVASITGLNPGYCTSAPLDTLTGNFTPAGSFAPGFPGITPLANGMAQVNPALLAPGGPYFVVYAYTNAYGCTDTDTSSFVVYPDPVVSFSGLDTVYCEGSVLTYTLTGIPSGGTFTGPAINQISANTAEIIPGSLSAGTGYSVTYSFTSPQGCTTDTTRLFDVVPTFIAQYTGLDSLYCEGTPYSDTLFGNSPTGLFTGPAGLTNLGNGTAVLDPSALVAGNTYVITFSDPSAGACMVADTQSFSIHANPNAYFNGLNSAYCGNSVVTDTLIGIPAGGVFSGIPGITPLPPDSAIISTAGLTPGNSYSIVYSYTDSVGCSDTGTLTFTLNAVPAITLSALASGYCEGTTTLDTLVATPAGGVFSGPAGFLQISPDSAVLDPSGLAVQTWQLFYTITDSIGCASEDTATFDIYPNPIASIAGLDPGYCATASPDTLTGNYAPDGFFQSVTPGITALPNGQAEINPAALAAGGPYQVKYTYTSPQGCFSIDTSSFVIYPQPVVSFSGLEPAYCAGSIVPDTLTGNLSGGTFTGTAVNPLSPTQTEILPGSLPAGTGYTITYTFTSAQGCTSDTTETFDVISNFISVFTGLDSLYCEGIPYSDTLFGNSGAGAFTGPAGLVDLGNGTAVLDPSALVAGNTYMVIFSVPSAGACMVADTQSFSIHANPNAYFNGLNSAYCGNSVVTDTLIGIPAGGVFSGIPGITPLPPDSAIISTAGLTPGNSYSIVYSYTDSVGCSDTGTLTFTLNAVPAITLSALAPGYCEGTTTLDTLVATPAGGVFSGPAGLLQISPDSAVLDPSGLAVQTWQIFYSITDSIGCASEDTAVFDIYPNPIASIAGLDPGYCATASPDTLTGNYAPDGFFQSVPPGITALPNGQAEINPAAITPGGPYQVIYSYTSLQGCSSSDTSTFAMYAMPVVSFSGLDTAYCEGVLLPDTLTGNQSGGVFSGPTVTPVSPTQTEIIPGSLIPGIYTINYAYTSPQGCVADTSIDFSVISTNPGSFTGLDSLYCESVVYSDTLFGNAPLGTFSGPAGLTNLGNGMGLLDPSGLSTGSTYSIIFNPGGNCALADTQIFEIRPNPTASFTGLNTAYCGGIPVTDTLTGIPAGGVFSGIPGLTPLPPASAILSTAGLSAGTSYPLVYTYSDVWGCQDADTLSLYINPAPTISLSAIANGYCLGETLVDTIMASPAGGTFSGPAGLTQTGTSTATLDPSALIVQGYQIFYTLTDSIGCITEDTLSFDVYPLPIITISGIDSTYCPLGQNDTIQFSPSGGILTSGFTGLTQNGAFGLVDPSGAVPGNYPFQYTFTDSLGCTGIGVDSLAIIANSQSTIQLPLDTFCTHDAAITISATPATGVFDPQPFLTDLGGGVAIVNPTQVSGSQGFNIVFNAQQACWLPDTAFIQFWTAQPADIIGLQPQYCAGDSPALLIGTPANIPGSFAFSGTANLTDFLDGTAELSFPAGATGVQTIHFFSEDLHGCRDTISQNTNIRPLPIADAGPDQTILQGNQTIMAGNAPLSGQSGSWILVSGSGTVTVGTDPQTNVVVSAPGSGWIWQVSDSLCGIASDTMYITLGEMIIPTGFSPNGDGLNDFWEIVGLDNFEKVSVSIFNRWGSEIYHTEDYDNGWNGNNMSNQPLADDTYFAVIHLDDAREFKTYIVIKR